MQSTKKAPARHGSFRWKRALAKGAVLGVLAVAVAGCVVEPYPPTPPGAYYAAPPDAYYAAPAYYGAPYPAYYDYPAYYGPPLTVGVGVGGGRRYWR